MTESGDQLPDPDETLDLDPAAILAAIDRQQREVDAAMLRGLPWLYLVWGVTWLVGYLLLWSAWPSGNPWFTVPVPVAAGGFAALVVGASVASAIIGIRLGRGIRGASDFSSTVYGMSWPILSVAFLALGMAMVAHGLSIELTSLYYASIFSLMAGALYLAGAALWQSRGQLVIGLIMVAAGAATPFAGTPLNLLLMAVFGGGALLVAGAMTAVRLRSRR